MIVTLLSLSVSDIFHRIFFGINNLIRVCTTFNVVQQYNNVGVDSCTQGPIYTFGGKPKNNEIDSMKNVYRTQRSMLIFVK